MLPTHSFCEQFVIFVLPGGPESFQECWRVSLFRPPRRSDLSGPLLELAQREQLSDEHVQAARSRVDKLHRGTLDQLWSEASVVPEPREQLAEAFDHAHQLLQLGLEHLEKGSLHLGRLILEKGEDEYLWLLGEMHRYVQRPPRSERSKQWWQRLQRARQEGETDLAAFELALHLQLEGIQRDFRRALARLSDDGEGCEQAMRKSLERLHEFLGL